MRQKLIKQENYTNEHVNMDQDVHLSISTRLTPQSTLIISNQAKNQNKGVMSKDKTKTKEEQRNTNTKNKRLKQTKHPSKEKVRIGLKLALRQTRDPWRRNTTRRLKCDDSVRVLC